MDGVDHPRHFIKLGCLKVISKPSDAICGVQTSSCSTQLRSCKVLINVFRGFVPKLSTNCSTFWSQTTKGPALHPYIIIWQVARHVPCATGEAYCTTGTRHFRIARHVCSWYGQLQPTHWMLTPPKPFQWTWKTYLVLITIANARWTQCDTTHLEFLAVGWVVALLPPYLEGIHFMIRNGHDALNWMLNFAYATGQLRKHLLVSWSEVWSCLCSFIYISSHGRVFKTTYHSRQPNTNRWCTIGYVSRLLTEQQRTIMYQTIVSMVYNEDTVFSIMSPTLPVVHSATTSKPEMKTAPPTLTKLAAKQAKDMFCRHVAATIGMHGSCHLYGRRRVLVCTYPLYEGLQTLMPDSIRPPLSYLSHYPKLIGHPGECPLYDAMRHELYWLHTTNDV